MAGSDLGGIIAYSGGQDRFVRAMRDTDVVNAVIKAAPRDSWLYYGYNAEYLFYPFSDSRTVGEMLAFHAEERRRAMLTYVIDLYAPDLTRFPDAVSTDEAMFDRTGYYALASLDRTSVGHQGHHNKPAVLLGRHKRQWRRGHDVGDG